MAKLFKKIWEAIGSIELVQSIIHTEFVRTFLLPFISSIAAAVAGYLQGMQVMWIIMATALTFMAVMQGLLRTSEFIERKNPINKLKFMQAFVGLDLNEPVHPNRAQRRDVAVQPAFAPRSINRMQVGIDMKNDATFPLSVIFVSAESEIEGITPPRTVYPKPPIIVAAGGVFRLVDERMSMNAMPCKILIGKYQIKVKYGLPGKEHFELNFNHGLEIHMQPFGLITNIACMPQEAVI